MIKLLCCTLKHKVDYADNSKRQGRTARFSAAAELKLNLKSSKGWAGIAGLVFVYSVFAILGSGIILIVWGFVLLLAGVRVYYLMRKYNLKNN